MAAHDTLTFTDFDPVTGPPNVNGYVYDDIGTVTAEFESGYVNGSRMMLGGSGLPPVVIQCVKQGNNLVLGFFCRGDFSFDDNDAVVIALRPNSGAANMVARRLDIFPVWGDHPPPPDTGVGFGAADPTSAADPFGHEVIPIAGAPNIHAKKRARSVTFYTRANNIDDWVQYTPASFPSPDVDAGPADPGAVYRIRTRSWEPTSTPFEAAWSLEVRLPINKAGGGADWIDLSNDFGLYINIVRAGRTIASGTDADYYCKQFRFPDFASAVPPVATNSRLTGELDNTADIQPDWYGKALINPPANQTHGVRFKGQLTSVGRRVRGNTTTTPSHSISRTVDNDMVAILENTGPAASGITATFRLANWGLNGPSAWGFPSGLQRPSSVVDLLAGTPLAPSAEGVAVSQWDAVDVAAVYPVDSHQCMWVDLTSTTNVNFTQSSIRRNMDFVNMSSHSQSAEVSGEGYPEPENGTSEHDFVLFTRCRKIIVKELVDSAKKFQDDKRRKIIDDDTLEMVTAALTLAPDVPSPKNNTEFRDVAVSRRVTRPQWEDSVVFLWVTEGFRKTGQHLAINGTKYEVFDEAPGAFGYVAHHSGIADNFSWSFSGPNMGIYRPGVYGLKVPHKGRVQINVTISAEPHGPLGDVSKELPQLKPQGGDGNSGGPKPDENGGSTTPGKTGCPAVILALMAIPAIWAVAQAVI